MSCPDKREFADLTSIGSDCAPQKLVAADVSGERATSRAGQALLVFANPAAIDCKRRKWPTSFQQLFNVGRLSEIVTPDTDVHIFTSVEPAFAKTHSYKVHLQTYTGASFGKRLEEAVETVATLGYQKIVIIGSDCPSLKAEDVSNAFRVLEHRRLVLGPDHRGGCYLIGLHREDRSQLAGVRWHQNTDCAELARRFGRGSTARLAVKIDLDTTADLRLLAKSKNSCSELASALLRCFDVIHPEAETYVRRDATKQQILSWQLPPPSLAII